MRWCFKIGMGCVYSKGMGGVGAAQQEGSVRSDIDASDMTRILLGTINYPVFWFSPEGVVSPNRLAELIGEMALAGVARR